MYEILRAKGMCKMFPSKSEFINFSRRKSNKKYLEFFAKAKRE